ncbi:MAG: phosphotransferase [Calditrichaeota bacterium]|nr:phosphotransferase [Calditrichota bacterium]
MANKSLKQNLFNMFERWAGEKAQSMQPLPAHGSDRKYFRIIGSTKRAIGVYNPDMKENIAFLTFTKHFRRLNLNVPEIYSQELDKNIYLEQDLGDTTLFSFLTEVRQKEGFSSRIIEMYRKTVEYLPRFQIEANRGLDYSVCYPRSGFDRQSMHWDLNYFKYYFLKLAKIPFDEQSLENDFQAFMDFLLSTDRDYFLYRDFQSRNVMIVEGEPYFIDYQGGRKGALQYDLASLLFDAKADLPNEVRQELLNYYLDRLETYIPVDRQKFLQYYYGYVYIRIMQALGAYGFRGFYERKEHFLKSVPYAIQNLEWLLHNAELPVELPALTAVWEGLVRSSYLRQFGDARLRLTVRIQSFSYKRGIPVDEKGHGGGFVFDCRMLPNPGRFEKYKDVTGNDDPVIEFLEKEKEVDEFMSHVKGLLDMMVTNYLKRNFTDIMVAFGCTGGQHRSVYCANQLAEYLKKKYDIDIQVRHRELEMIAGE